MLLRTAATIDRINARIGRAAAWLVLVLVLVQFAIVVMRYVFAIGFVWMQESVLYLYGALFMLGAGYAFLHDDHVRVDVFYRGAPPTVKAAVDLAGAVVLAAPFCALVVWSSWDYVLVSWSVGERSSEALGLPLAFAFKTLIWVFAMLLGAQAVSMAIKALMFLAGLSATYPVNGQGE